MSSAVGTSYLDTTILYTYTRQLKKPDAFTYPKNTVGSARERNKPQRQYCAFSILAAENRHSSFMAAIEKPWGEDTQTSLGQRLASS